MVQLKNVFQLSLYIVAVELSYFVVNLISVSVKFQWGGNIGWSIHVYRIPRVVGLS